MSANDVAKRRWWTRVDRTQTIDASIITPEPAPSLDARKERCRYIKNQIVQKQCEIARLEGELDDELKAFVIDLKTLDAELTFGRFMGEKMPRPALRDRHD